MTENNTGGITKMRSFTSVITDAMRAITKAVKPLLRAMAKAVARLGRAIKSRRESRERARQVTVTVGVRVQPYMDDGRIYYGMTPQVIDRRPAVSHRLNY